MKKSKFTCLAALLSLLVFISPINAFAQAGPDEGSETSAGIECSDLSSLVTVCAGAIGSACAVCSRTSEAGSNTCMFLWASATAACRS